MTVGELCERMSYRELLEWMVFDLIEGLQDKRDDLRAGHQTMHLWAGLRWGTSRHLFNPRHPNS